MERLVKHKILAGGIESPRPISRTLGVKVPPSSVQRVAMASVKSAREAVDCPPVLLKVSQPR
jgi:hypothetical protein